MVLWAQSGKHSYASWCFVFRCKIVLYKSDTAKVGDFEALSQAPMVGLARVIHSEEAKIFGGLINVKDAWHRLNMLTSPRVVLERARGIGISLDPSLSRSGNKEGPPFLIP